MHYQFGHINFLLVFKTILELEQYVWNMVDYFPRKKYT